VLTIAVSTFGICQFPTLDYSEPRQTLKTIGSLEQEYGIVCVTGASLAWDPAPHPRGLGGGGVLPYRAIKVCAAVKCVVYKQFTLG